MKKLLALGLSFFSLTFVSAQTPEPAPQPPTPKSNPGVAQMPVEPAFPYTPSLDVNAMDKSTDPCVDFYQYSCGGWKKNNPIPPDQTSWSVYGKLYQDNLNFLRGILEEAAQPSGSRDAVTQKIGDFYAACLDESAVEKRGAAPIKADLDAIARLKSTRDLAPLVARLQLATQGSGMVFGGGSTQDPDNSEQQIAGLDQGGLGLPDRDYYTKDDAKSKETREKYLQHVQKIFELLGDNAEAAKKNADVVMKIESALAKSSLTRVERRDPYKLKNKMNAAQLNQLAPNFNWQAYFQAVNAPKFDILNVTAPAFFKELNAELTSQPLDNWKTYLRFHLANAYSPYLSSPFVTENFDFYRKYLRGAKEQQPRWKRCVQYVDRDLGEAL
ncbi:MAG TPA: M13 family metallopeptidase N-terminal domain-containing protein, partial [Terriglobales bacterium]